MIYTYDTEADVLYVLLGDERSAAIEKTEELTPNLHVDLDASGAVIGVDFLYPRSGGLDPTPVRDRFGLDLDIPFRFAA
jgi:uncharacterized protein YuzE